MKNLAPVSTGTIVNELAKEWFPKSFDDFLLELQHIENLFNRDDNLVVFRGHRKKEWLLDSTFVRSCKAVLFGLKEHDKFSQRLCNSRDLHLALLNLFLLKFGTLVHPSQELADLEAKHGIDPWFELLKRVQQHPNEMQDGPFCIRGTNILDWTKSADVALYFANEGRNGDGALYICDATATGKTQQIIPVGGILEKMDKEGNSGKALGVPLVFHPARQILNQRAKNQQAIYFSQMDLRVDLETIWREQEKGLADQTIVLKLVLPSGTESKVKKYLLGKGITSEFLFPNS